MTSTNELLSCYPFVSGVQNRIRFNPAAVHSSNELHNLAANVPANAPANAPENTPANAPANAG